MLPEQRHPPISLRAGPSAKCAICKCVPVAGLVSLGNREARAFVQMRLIVIAKRGNTMKKFAFLTLGLLAGCSVHSKADQNAAYQAANQRCMDTKVRTRGSWVSLAECTNAVDEQYDTEPAGPQIRAARLSLAYKIDHGEISAEEARAELLRVAIEVRHEQQRTNAADAASATAIVGAMPRPVPQVKIAQPTDGEETPVTPPSPPIEQLSPSPERENNHHAKHNHRRSPYQHHRRNRHQTAHRTHHHGKRE